MAKVDELAFPDNIGSQSLAKVALIHKPLEDTQGSTSVQDVCQVSELRDEVGELGRRSFNQISKFPSDETRQTGSFHVNKGSIGQCSKKQEPVTRAVSIKHC
jgi:hypothetical protein